MMENKKWKLFLLVFCFFMFPRGEADKMSWFCEDGNFCKKKVGEGGVGFEACRLQCGSLWPKPNSFSISKNLKEVKSDGIDLKVPGASKKVEELSRQAVERVVKRNFGKCKEGNCKSGAVIEINLNLNDPKGLDFTLRLNEAYNLTVKAGSKEKIVATIHADNYFGGKHGLETLGQLLVFDETGNNLVVPEEVMIQDKPAYPYRGLLIDTARNFIKVPAILRTLDGMELNKLNTFHWHITDSQSFPFQSKSFPKLHETGAYSPEKVYSHEDIEKIVEYGRARGIRILPEFDAPAHVGEGWSWVGDNATVCFKSEPWRSYCVEPPCGQLNPTSEKVYQILKGIYKDMEEAFKSPDLFHMGGDEVNVNCWNTSEPVINGMSKWGLGRTNEDFHRLWSKFQDKALKTYEETTGKTRPVILWTSTLTEKGHVEKYLDKDKYIIQIWTKGNDPVIGELVNKGFPVIMSNYEALYLDCGFSAWVGEGNNWCSPFIPWQTVYENDPIGLAKGAGADEGKAESLVLGAEATLWTEQADDSSLDNKLWPRGAAMAERLWIGKGGSWEEAKSRFIDQWARMRKAGIDPNTIQPEWCTQNQGAC